MTENLEINSYKCRMKNLWARMIDFLGWPRSLQGIWIHTLYHSCTSRTLNSLQGPSSTELQIILHKYLRSSPRQYTKPKRPRKPALLNCLFILPKQDSTVSIWIEELKFTFKSAVFIQFVRPTYQTRMCARKTPIFGFAGQPWGKVKYAHPGQAIVTNTPVHCWDKDVDKQREQKRVNCGFNC